MRQINIMHDANWTDPLPIFAWAIETAAEGVIVVDTGETARTSEPGYFPRWHPYFRFAVKLDVTPELEIGPQLRSLGIGPEDVRTVILTHLHTDHAGGLHHFPKSEVLVDEGEWRLAQGFAEAGSVVICRTVGQVGSIPSRFLSSQHPSVLSTDAAGSRLTATW